MPMYDLMCLYCKHEFETFSKVIDKDNIKCEECGEKTKTLITQHGFQFIEGFDEHLDTYITGPGHKARVMKSKNLSEINKCEAHRMLHSVTKKKQPTVHDACLSARKKGKFALGEIG